MTDLQALSPEAQAAVERASPPGPNWMIREADGCYRGNKTAYDIYCNAREDIPMLAAGWARAEEALRCRHCGKQKPYVAICFDCLDEDVDEIAHWHKESSLSGAEGTEDICSQCHTGWPCDAIKALKLRVEDRAKLEAVEKVLRGWPHGSAGRYRRLIQSAILGGSR